MWMGKKISSGIFDESTETCIALLVIALGCAGYLICPFVENENSDCDDVDSRSQRRTTSELYFDIAFKKIRLAQAECSVEAVQCLFFTGNQIRLRQRECLRRIFWSCYILERSVKIDFNGLVSANIHSDDLAELSALPLTGVADIELSVPLPGVCHTQGSLTDEEQSSLYFLACISMRRLLNRATNLLYARDTGVGFDESSLPLSLNSPTNWRVGKNVFLPSSSFLSIKSRQGHRQGQRYLTCKSVIYRPYLTWALWAAAEELTPAVYEGCKTCLNARWLHALNLCSLPHTVCSLSLSISYGHLSQDVITLAPALFQQNPGHGVSPSVLQSLSRATPTQGTSRFAAS
ncbi:hypothetical protein V1523DRAFT_397973 [Lipomyces doorenjongii]